MQIIRSLKDHKKITKPLCLTIGNFDGVHLGHKEIIKQVKKIATKDNILSAILTFEPHPIQVLQSNVKADFRINSLADKLRIFSEQNIDLAIILRFDRDLAQITAEDFVADILIKKLRLQHLAVGYDFTFGSNRMGNFNFLQERSREHHFTLEKIFQVRDNEITLSSSLIRELVKKGEVSEVKKYLGYNFNISGLVVSGRSLGSKIGVPTANVLSKKNIIKPKFGVYRTITYIGDYKFRSITNFGTRPTVNLDDIAIFENHIFNFDQNIYGQKIKIEFIDFIRSERKFASKEELITQIKQDIASVNRK